MPSRATAADSLRSRLPHRLAFVGGGNMARSLIGGLIAQGVEPARIIVSEPQETLRDALHAEFGVRVEADNRNAVREAGLALLAVKPQAMRAVCAGLAGHVGDALIVSIAAGITCDQLGAWLGTNAVVRCMPNTPALLGAGVTGLFATARVEPQQRDAAEALLAAVGRCVWIEQESQMDAVTAVSGSGPAYVFLLAEAMQDAGIAMGLAPESAGLLVNQTLLGAARMLDESGESAALLRQRVTSPGGTTQAALERFELGGLRSLVREALAAAQRRGAELSRELGA